MPTSLYNRLTQRRADLTAQARAILDAAESEERGLTDDERQRLDALNAELETIAADLQREERLRDALRSQPVVQGVHDRVLDKPWGYDYGVRVIQGADGTRRLGGIPNATAVAFGEFLQAVYAQKRYGQTDPRLYEAAVQGASEAIGSDGGFLVGKELLDDIMLNVMSGDILSRVDQRTISTNANAIDINVVDETSRATGSRFGGVQGYWVDEGTAPTASRPKFAKLELKLRKLAALGYATDELLADAALVGSTMQAAFAEELRFLAENAIVRGTGAGQPVGWLNAAAKISVAKESGQAADTVVFQNILKMWSRMWARSRRNAVWFINQDIEPQLFSMSMSVGSGGVPVYMPANGISGAPFATLMGRPVIPVEYASTLGDEGDIMLVDPSQYLFIQKGGIQQATSLHVAFTTDEMAFRATWRVDGQLKWRSAITPFQGSNTLSPVVTLAARA